MIEAGRAAESRNSGLFNLPVGVPFSRLPDGRGVVYPWPRPLSVGCVLPDGAAEIRLRAMMRRWLWMALPVFIVFGFIGSHALISAALVYMAAYYGRLLIATRGLPRMRGQAAAAIWRRSAENEPAHNIG
jgi:hypothetical protein